jgi:hypothetical protein
VRWESCCIDTAGNGFGGSFNLCTTRSQDNSHVESHPQRITSRAFRPSTPSQAMPMHANAASGRVGNGIGIG